MNVATSKIISMKKLILKNINEIASCLTSVRNHINIRRYQKDFISDKSNWLQICSSLDVIRDNCDAIAGYINAEYPDDIGLKYLFLYGLLQTLYVQQDAILNLSEAFRIEYRRTPELNEIRLMRNSAIGHPTKQDRTKDDLTYYNFITQVSLSFEGFSLMRSHGHGAGEHIFSDIKLFPMICNQLDGILSALKDIENKLKEEDKLHKNKYKGKLLVDIFSSSMNYLFSKVAEGVHSPHRSNIDFGLSMLQHIQETYREFEDALNERGDISEGTKYELDQYNHAILRLKTYFKMENENMTDSDARIYHFYIQESHKWFESIAKEIDDEYMGK